jgi:cell division protein FtsL
LERTNKLSAQLVEIQKLSSKERITKIAKERLGLINPLGPFEVLKINNNTVNTVDEVVRELDE